MVKNLPANAGDKAVFPSSETGMSGNFWGRIKRSKYRFALQNGTLDFSWGSGASQFLFYYRELIAMLNVTYFFSSHKTTKNRIVSQTLTYVIQLIQ